MAWLAQAARAIARALWAWAKNEAVEIALEKGEEWLHDLADWVLADLTARGLSAWKKKGTAMLGPELELQELHHRKALDLIIEELLSRGRGAIMAAVYKDAITASTTPFTGRESFLVDQDIIPRDESVHAWARRVAATLSLSADEVLKRRTGS